jgi:hypothetical protein
MNIGGVGYIYGASENNVLKTSPRSIVFLVLDHFNNSGTYLKTSLTLMVNTVINGKHITYFIQTIGQEAKVGHTPNGFREKNGQQILKRVVSIAQQVKNRNGQPIPCETQTNKALNITIKNASLWWGEFGGSHPYGDWNPKDTRMTSKITNYAGDYVAGTDASYNFRTPDIPRGQESEYSKASSDKIYLFTGKK